MKTLLNLLTFSTLILFSLTLSAETTLEQHEKTTKFSLQNTQEFKLKRLGSFRVNTPAFMNVAPLPSNSSKPGLLLSSFSVNPFEYGRVRVVENVGDFLDDVTKIKPVDISSGVLSWANEAQRIPFNVFNKNYLWVADGFLVPGKNNGGVYIIEVIGEGRYGRSIPISQPKNSYFYHKVIWYDINGDGRLDCIAARATVPIFGSSKGELIWLEHPAQGAETSRWKEHFLVEGPDVHFVIDNLDEVPNTIQLIATQFFTKRVMLYSFTVNVPNPRLVYSRLIDDKIGAAYDVSIVDLNGDGKKDLLVTNHEGKEADSGLFAYEIPYGNIRNGVFKYHLLSRGFPTRNRGPNEASPGFAYTFYPNTQLKGGRPHILVSGDGSQEAYYFYPIGGNKSFAVKGGPIIRVGGTQGDVTFGDVDGDGWTEVFVPNYDGQEVHVFKFGY